MLRLHAAAQVKRHLFTSLHYRQTCGRRIVSWWLQPAPASSCSLTANSNKPIAVAAARGTDSRTRNPQRLYVLCDRICRCELILQGVSKTDTALACCNFDEHRTILTIFGRNVAQKVSSQTVLYFPQNFPPDKLKTRIVSLLLVTPVKKFSHVGLFATNCLFAWKPCTYGSDFIPYCIYGIF